MIRIITIDDEPLALKLLEVYASRIEDVELVAACANADDAAAALAKHTVDCIFTDINMPGMSGLEFVKKLQNPPMVVFTTAYSEYAVEGFRVNAIDYLVKPISFDDFTGAVERVRRQLQLIAGAGSAAAGGAGYGPAGLGAGPGSVPGAGYGLGPGAGLAGSEYAPVSEGDSVFFFKVGHQKRRVFGSEITYVESLGAYLKVFCGEEMPFIVLGNFKSIQDTDSERFVRIHKSYMVNRNKVRQAGKTSVTLLDGTTIPVGGAYRDEIDKIYG